LLNSGRPNLPQSWNRYAYTLNNPLKYIDPDGLYEWGASLGGKKSDAEVSEEIRNRRALFKAALARAQTNLEAIKKKFGETSDAYIKAQKAVDAYGTFGDKNKVFVGVVADTKQDKAGNTSPMDSNGNVYVTFQQSKFDQGLANSGGQMDTEALAGLTTHEGWHVDETKHGISLGTWDSEYSGLFVQTVMGTVEHPNGWAHFFLGPEGNKREVQFWNSSWTEADRAVTNRDNAIREVLQAPKNEGGYGLNPPKKP